MVRLVLPVSTLDSAAPADSSADLRKRPSYIAAIYAVQVFAVVIVCVAAVHELVCNCCVIDPENPSPQLAVTGAPVSVQLQHVFDVRTFCVALVQLFLCSLYAKPPDAEHEVEDVFPVSFHTEIIVRPKFLVTLRLFGSMIVA